MVAWDAQGDEPAQPPQAAAPTGEYAVFDYVQYSVGFGK
jgi:hypothetical protein